MENPVLERGFPSESSLSHHSHADKSMILETSWFLRKSFVWVGFKRSLLCSCCSHCPCFLEILFCFEKEKLFRETRRNRQGLACSNLRFDLEIQNLAKKVKNQNFPAVPTDLAAILVTTEFRRKILFRMLQELSKSHHSHWRYLWFSLIFPPCIPFFSNIKK